MLKTTLESLTQRTRWMRMLLAALGWLLS